MESTQTEIPVSTETAPVIEQRTIVLATDGAEVKPADAEPKPTGKEFAALKRSRQRAEAAEAQLTQKVQHYEPVLAKATALEAAYAAGDVETVMSLTGITPEQLVDLYVKTHGDAPEEKSAETVTAEKIAALEAKLTKSEQDQLNHQVQAAVNGHISSIQQTAQKEPDRFELVLAESATQLVFDVMVEHHRLHNEYLTYDAALQLTEDALVEQRKAELTRLSGFKKLGKLNQSSSEAASPAETGVSERMRQAFMADSPKKRVIVNNSASTATVAAPNRLSKGALADQRFHEKVAALVRASR